MVLKALVFAKIQTYTKLTKLVKSILIETRLYGHLLSYFLLKICLKNLCAMTANFIGGRPASLPKNFFMCGGHH